MLYKKLETRIEINKPIDQVRRVLSSLETYHSWNPRTSFSSKPAVGKIIMMKVKLFGMWLAVPVKIQTLDDNEGVRWIGGIPGVITGSHYFKLSGEHEEITLLTQGEEFKGVLVPILLPAISKALYDLYKSFNESLKAHCETSGV